jgi:hypothetical protein
MKSIPLQNTIYKAPGTPPVRQQLRAAFRSTFTLTGRTPASKKNMEQSRTLEWQA